MALPDKVTTFWTDFYEREKNDEGPFQALFETHTGVLTTRTARNTADVHRLTEVITGSGHGNMMLIPGNDGMVQVIHHGFGTDVNGEFALVFAHGNHNEFATFKVLEREAAVEPIAKEPDDEDDADGPTGVAARNAPGFLSLIEVGDAKDFGELLPEESDALMEFPNHFMIHPKVFALTMGARSVQSKHLAFEIIETIIAPFREGEANLNEGEKGDGSDYGCLLAWLWAVANGLLPEVRLHDVPDTNVMNNVIKRIRGKLVNRDEESQQDDPRSTGRGGNMGRADEDRQGAEETHRASIEMMASSSQTMAALMTKMQEGNEFDRNRKEAERSLLKTMGPTQRELFTSLCTTRMNRPPKMTEFMISLTTSKTPQKAISLIQSETRDWEGTFSAGGFHRMLSHGFMSNEANRANPGGFTLFMFHPKTVELEGGGKTGGTSNALLREYLGMEIEEETLAYYAKQGFYIPSNQNDLRIQLQTALHTLELLTCDQSIATKGLAYVLEPKRWAKLTTNMNDRFKTEPEFGTKFCYTLDRHLQIFFDKMTRWVDIQSEGDQHYLVSKAEDLIERIEDGRGLNIVLPAVLNKGRGNDDTKTRSPKQKTRPSSTEPSPKRKKTPDGKGTDSEHDNSGKVTEWALPTGMSFNELFKSGAKNWPSFLDDRIPTKSNKSQVAPMCVRFQAMGKCKRVCQLAHISASDMPPTEREKVDNLFKTAYGGQ